MMPVEPMTLSSVSLALNAGQVAVVWMTASDSRDTARRQARHLCTELLQSPGLSACHVSRSATSGLAAVALSTCHVVGLDIEGASLTPTDDLRTMLHPLEQDMLLAASNTDLFMQHAWSRKEAVLKALGIGLALEAHQFAVGPFCVSWQRVRCGAFGDAMVRSINHPTGIAVALAAAGGVSPAVSLFTA